MSPGGHVYSLHPSGWGGRWCGGKGAHWPCPNRRAERTGQTQHTELRDGKSGSRSKNSDPEFIAWNLNSGIQNQISESNLNLDSQIPRSRIQIQELRTWNLKSRSMGLPWWLSGKESACQCRRHRFDPWVRKIPWRRAWQPAPVFLPGESCGQRSLVNYSPWGHKELDMTEQRALLL